MGDFKATPSSELPNSVGERRRRGPETGTKSTSKQKMVKIIDLSYSSEEEEDSPVRLRFSIQQSPAVDIRGALEFAGTPHNEDDPNHDLSFKIRESILSSSSASSSSKSSSESEAEFDENDGRFKITAEDEVDDDISFIVDSDDLDDIFTSSGSGSDLSSDEEEEEEEDKYTPGKKNSNGREEDDGNVFDFGELQEVIMEYEPVKPIKALASSPLAKSPTRKPLQEIMSTPTNSNSSVLREKESVPKTKKLTKKERLATTVETFADFNLKCFDDLLPADMSVSWNNRLRTTAGVTKMKTKRLSDGKENVRVASIELSEKVVDDVERLRATLLHEMCHAAAWLVDAQKKPPHGPAFWKWASIAGARSGGYLVTTCHNYEVHRPFKWQCATPTCGIEYTRHSKKGIDPLRHRCGKCRGRIEFVGAFNADMTPKKTRAATGFSLFVQEHFANVKTSLKKKGKTSAHQSVMQELSRLYAISKGSASKASGD